MKKCLLIVDMINGFINEGILADKGINRITNGIVDLANKYIVNKSSIIFVNDAHQDDSKEFKTFPSHCLVGSREAEIVKELLPIALKAQTFYKNSVNGMMNTALVQYLKDNKFTDYYIVGCCTDLCILNLALSLKTFLDENNIDAKVNVISNLVETFDNANHPRNIYNESAFRILKINGVNVLESGEGIASFIQEKLLEANKKGIVLGFSSGIDSALIAAICLRNDIPVHLVSLPYNHEHQARMRDFAQSFNCQIKTISIKKIADDYINLFQPIKEITRINILPRVRMSIFYALASELDYLVIGTSNMDERMLGYFTKWGDGASDLLPLANVTKQEIWTMARYLNIPDSIVSAIPSADLYPGQSDEQEMGITYQQSYDYIIKGSSGNAEIDQKIKMRQKNNQHKMQWPESYEGGFFMCGIIGYCGKKNSIDILIDGLKALEYRGYDSAGISYLHAGGVVTHKKKGRVENLAEEVEKNRKCCPVIGIGHTRWATHGVPSSENSHPLFNREETMSVVHNGIIENYQEIKVYLKNKGYQFLSETDTEVIVQLLDYYHKKTSDLLFSFYLTVSALKGSYAIAVISSDTNKILATRKDSPLIVGVGNEEFFLASDKSAMIKYTNRFIYLNDGEFAIIDQQNVVITDGLGQSIKPEVVKEELTLEEIQKNGFPHFMLKEIYEQPKIIQTVTNNYLNGNSASELKELFKDINRVYFIGCGTAYYAGLAAGALMEKYFPQEVKNMVASEFRYSEAKVDEHSLVIVISQSGETADTLAALRLAKKRGAKTIGIINVLGSTIAREVDKVFYTLTGPEIAVASTKAYTGQVLTLLYLLHYLAHLESRIGEEKYRAFINAAQQLPGQVTMMLDAISKVEDIAKKYQAVTHFFFIGRQLDYYSTLEGALKLKEIAYIPSESYPAGELKHGPLAMIDEKTLVVALANNDNLMMKMESNIREVKSRGAKVLLISTSRQLTEVSDDFLQIPETEEYLIPILVNVYQQLLAYQMAKLLSRDIDKPRNLAKSVTVE
ncbi:glucosamine--fructose-6-phosphate aminotransferase isomerizing [Holotrichia oblita]|nr:glucosamine--fructose-6-phosphate aminotransferase isomerizing [Holotrichia oblita]